MQFRNKIIAIALLCLLLPTAQAFTQTTATYIALKTFDTECKEEMAAGIQKTYNPKEALNNPDFLEKNKQCPNLESDCPAKTMADKYRSQARIQTGCQKENTKGIMASYYINAYNPANRKNVEEGCKMLFDQEIENKITLNKTEFLIAKDCPTDQNTNIQLKFSNDDLNTLIKNLNDYWEQTQIQTEDIEQAKATAETMFKIIEEKMGKDPTPEEITITAKTILEMKQYSCQLATKDKMELYQKWKGLTGQSKACLKNFLSGNSVTFWEFTGQCPAFGADPNNIMQYGTVTWNAYLSLEEYFNAGFATRQCQETQYSSIQGTSTQSMPTCQYTPKKLTGCIDEFQDRQETESQAAEQGAINAIAWGAAIFGAVALSLFMFLRKGV